MTDFAGLLGQGPLIQEVASAIAGDNPRSWSKLTYHVRALRNYLQGELVEEDARGGRAESPPPDSSIDPTLRLREIMYSQGAGTWFSATITVTAAGAVDADFDYDNEPEWTRPVDPYWYVQDLEKFPRDEEARPEWLRRRLSEAFTA